MWCAAGLGSAALGQIINIFNIPYHLSVDDILYFPFKPNEAYRLCRLKDYLYIIRDWTMENFLQLNTDKTEVLIATPDNSASMIRHRIGPLSSAAHSNKRNLGVIFDQSLLFDAHFKQLEAEADLFFTLRNISFNLSFKCFLKLRYAYDQTSEVIFHLALTVVMHFFLQ